MNRKTSLKRYISFFIIIICFFSLFFVKSESYADNEDTIVHITKTGDCYHREGCSYLKSDIPITLREANELGKTPCSRCKPVVYDDTAEVAAIMEKYSSNSSKSNIIDEEPAASVEDVLIVFETNTEEPVTSEVVEKVVNLPTEEPTNLSIPVNTADTKNQSTVKNNSSESTLKEISIKTEAAKVSESSNDSSAFSLLAAGAIGVAIGALIKRKKK